MPLSPRLSILLSRSVGAFVGEEDHSASAAAANGLSFEVLKIAVKPGKPALVGRIGQLAVIWACLAIRSRASCLGCSSETQSSASLDGVKPKRPTGYPMEVISDSSHKPGRTQIRAGAGRFDGDGPRIDTFSDGEILARLKPLIDAHGLAEISSESGDLSIADRVLFHPFRDGFTF